MDTFSSYNIKIHKSVIMETHILSLKYLSVYNISGAMPHAELQKRPKLNSHPQGALSSRWNRHENRDLAMEEGANSYENVEWEVMV